MGDVWVRGFILRGLLLLVLSACAFPAPTPTPTPTPEPAPTIDYRSALDTLDTYRVQASLAVIPDPNTGLEPRRLDVEMEVLNRPQRARRTIIRGLKSMARPQDRYRTSDVLKFIEIGGDLYVSTGATWLKTPAQNDPQQGILDPALLIPDPNLFTLAGDIETVNGVPAIPYTFQSAATLAYLSNEERAAITRVEGTVWLAQEGKFIVRYRAVAEGTAFAFAFSPDPFPGRVEVTYDVRDVNAPLTIERPRDALGEAERVEEGEPILLDGFDNVPLPLPGDAEVVFQTRQLAIFTTRQSPEEVARFYANQLTALGWERQPVGQVSSRAVHQRWTRNGYELRLTIVSRGGEEPRTHVTIGINPP